MQSLKAKLDAFKRSKPGLFAQKLLDDRVPNLAALTAWGTISTLLPLLLGILGVAGLILRDPQRQDQIYTMLLQIIPDATNGPLGTALQNVRSSPAGIAGLFGLVLLLFNGSAFFANLASIFDQAYHVQSRNVVMQRLLSLLMLAITTALLIVSTLALGIGGLIGNVPLGLPIGPVLGRGISWSIAIVSVIVLFLLVYKLLPNAQQGWRNVLPGALLSTVLLFVISLLFPIYLSVFHPNQAYAVFGVFLVMLYYLYLLGFVFVLGAELNAFLQQPARSVALAEATQRAEQGQAQFNQESGELEAQTEGDAPDLPSAGLLGVPTQSARQQVAANGAPARAGQPAQGASRQSAPAPAGSSAKPATAPSLAGRLLGFTGLIVAALLLRNRPASREHASG